MVAYCRCAYCVFAHDAIELLTRSGRDAARLEVGLLEWHLADLEAARVAVERGIQALYGALCIPLRPAFGLLSVKKIADIEDSID